MTAGEQVPVMGTEQAERVADDVERLAEVIGLPFARWARQCHAVSVKLLYSGEFGRGRIARGTCKGVGGQHSWIVLGDDCYDERATVVDPTLWSYVRAQTGIFVGRNRQGAWHVPHGAGFFINAGMPCTHGGDFISLTPDGELSAEAGGILDML